MKRSQTRIKQPVSVVFFPDHFGRIVTTQTFHHRQRDFIHEVTSVLTESAKDHQHTSARVDIDLNQTQSDVWFHERYAAARQNYRLVCALGGALAPLRIEGLWYQHDCRHSARLLANCCVYPGVDSGVGRVKERHCARFSPAALERITLNTDKVRQENIIFVAGDVHIELYAYVTLDGDKQPLRCAPKVAKRGITLSLLIFSAAIIAFL